MWESEFFTHDNMQQWEDQDMDDKTWENVQQFFIGKWITHSNFSQTMAGDHRSQPRAKVEITDDQLHAVCKRFAPEIAKMKIVGGEEAVIEGNVRFLTAIARHTARFPNTRALAKNAADFVLECDQSELVTWAHAVSSAFKHCQDRYNRKVKKMMPSIARVVNAMRERDMESNTDLPLP